MNQHRFTLQPYKTPASRYTCPACNTRKSFVRYIDTETSQHLADHVGRCGREDKCGYHFKPGEYFKKVGSEQLKVGSFQSAVGSKIQTANSQLQTIPSFIHPEIANASFSRYGENNFVQYIITRFGFDMADKLVGQYRIGTCSYWPGSTIFWQLDGEGLLRTGKIMLYNRGTGKRIKQHFNHITWAHTLIGSGQLLVNSGQLVSKRANGAQPTANFTLRQCLFGEHLLNEMPNAHIALVESEKTAIIAAAHDPEHIWLACGGLSNLNPQLCRSLQNRTVTLYPDLGAYDKWCAKARYLQSQVQGSVFTVSRLLEDNANDEDRANGLDLGDLLG
jgi:hypothetical protein